MIRAADYGQNLLTASAAAAESSDALELTGGVVYQIATEWRLGTGTGKRLIVHGNGAIVRATAPMRAVLAVDGDLAIVRDTFLEAGRYADYGLYLHAASASSFENMDAYQARVDGIHCAGETDRALFRNFSARLPGTIFHTSGYVGPSPANIKQLVTGTCTVGGGSAYGRQVTFSGLTTTLASMGIRRGDWISIDPVGPGNTGSMFWAPILSVDSATQITLDFHAFFGAFASPCHFSIHVGDGFHFGPGRADNNIHRLDTCLAENTACSGFYLGGLYGQRVTNIQVNASGAHPVVIGGGAQDRHTLGTSIHGFYTEVGLNGASDHVLCEGAIGLDLSTSNAGGIVGVTNPSTNVGVSRNDQYLSDISRYEVPIGYPQTRVDASPQFSARAGSVVLQEGRRSVTVPWAGCTPSAKVMAMMGGTSPQLVDVVPVNGEFHLRAQQRARRDVAINFFVTSLS